jgi:hypothetical protein
MNRYYVILKKLFVIKLNNSTEIYFFLLKFVS